MSEIHPSAILSPRAAIGRDVRIGPYAVVEEAAELGDGCVLEAHAVVKRYTRLGPDNHIFEHAVLGGEPQDLGFRGAVSFLEIGRGNRFREGVTVHRGSKEGSATRLGDGIYLMANAHIAHDCVIGDHVIVANAALLAGHVQVAERAFISGAVTIHQFCRIGRLAMVAASARINQDCLPFVTTDGVPGRARALNSVGLKRSGVSPQEIAALKRAFRDLRGGGRLEEIVDAWDTEHRLVAELKAFIQTSERGFAHPSVRAD